MKQYPYIWFPYLQIFNEFSPWNWAFVENWTTVEWCHKKTHTSSSWGPASLSHQHKSLSNFFFVLSSLIMRVISWSWGKLMIIMVHLNKKVKLLWLEKKKRFHEEVMKQSSPKRSVFFRQNLLMYKSGLAQWFFLLDLFLLCKETSWQIFFPFNSSDVK